MSRTISVEFSDRHAWFYDESLAIWLSRFIQRAEAFGLVDEGPLARFVDTARRLATIGDQHADLDELLAPESCELFVTLANEVTDDVREAGSIDLRAFETTRLLGDLRARIRTHAPTVDAGPVVAVGEALVELVLGTLPTPPAGSWWLIGAPDGLATIPMRTEAPRG